MFVDQVKIKVKAGDGGRGCRSFYRDKYMRNGIPDGGDGGKGADIIVKADRNLYTLLDFKYNRHFTGRHGAHGSGNNRKGKESPSVVIRVPIGTVVKEVPSQCILRDLKEDGEEFVVAAGGRGGLGNRKGRESTLGEPGQDKELVLDLKLIAEAGVIGFPNAGKSTFISAVSNAHPKVAAYPFTTKIPVLGVVHGHGKSFVIADIPGLIEGSSRGKGLGDKFLRHIERTKILIHIVDMSGMEGRDPLDDYKIISQELKNYSKEVASKKRIIAANKMDLEGAQENLKEFKRAVKKTVYPISALNREGLEEIIEAVAKRI
ncbi:MAG: GTPase ObgE [Candidatus Omnitrophota bacterium]